MHNLSLTFNHLTALCRQDSGFTAFWMKHFIRFVQSWFFAYDETLSFGFRDKEYRDNSSQNAYCGEEQHATVKLDSFDHWWENLQYCESKQRHYAHTNGACGVPYLK